MELLVFNHRSKKARSIIPRRREGPMISFRLSQVVQGFSVSLCVEVSPEALASALRGEGSLEQFSRVPDELTDAIRLAVQGEALTLLHEADGRLRRRLFRKAVDLLAAERS